MDPNERIPGTRIIEDLTKLPPGIDVPEGVDRKDPKGWYVQGYTTRDGRTFYEFYKRGNTGVGATDPVHATVEGPLNTEQADRFKKEQADAGKEKPTNVYVGTNPQTGKPSQVTETPDPSAPGGVRRTYDDTQVPAALVPAKPSTEPPKTEDRGGRHYVWYPNPPSVGGGVWKDEGPAPATPAERTQQQADAGKTGRVSKQIGGKAYDIVTTETKGPAGETITEQHYEDPANPGVKIPTPLEAPTSQGVPNGSITTSTADGKTVKKTTYLRPDGTEHEVVDEANVAKPTSVTTDPQTGRTYETILNPDGTVKEKREVQTPASPASSYTYPELKLAYGNIANEVMSISKDIYSRVGTGPGKITKEEADRLFKPIYDQAQMRVSEINGIVSTQKSVWDQQLSTSNQRLDASTRMAGQAFGLAKDANLMAPGTGATAGQMVWDMMQAQKDFATGMGGLADPKLPGYLQAAMSMSPDMPGVPPAVPTAGAPPSITSDAGAPPSGADVAAANAATQAQSQAAFGGLGIPPVGGISNTTDAGGVPRERTPASSTVGTGVPPGYLAPAAGAGLTPPMPMPSVSGPGPGMPPPMPMPAPQPDPSATPPMPMPDIGGGITINIGHPGAQQQQQAYLQPATQPRRPSLQDHQKEAAGALLGMGFDQDVIDHLWRQNTGQGLGG